MAETQFWDLGQEKVASYTDSTRAYFRMQGDKCEGFTHVWGFVLMHTNTHTCHLSYKSRHMLSIWRHFLSTQVAKLCLSHFFNWVMAASQFRKSQLK